MQALDAKYNAILRGSGRLTKLICQRGVGVCRTLFVDFKVLEEAAAGLPDVLA